MEAEARLILAEAVAREAPPPKGSGTAIHGLFKPLGGVEIDLWPRQATRHGPIGRSWSSGSARRERCLRTDAGEP